MTQKMHCLHSGMVLASATPMFYFLRFQKFPAHTETAPPEYQYYIKQILIDHLGTVRSHLMKLKIMTLIDIGNQGHGCGLEVKCPPQIHAFQHLVPSCEHLFER